jgi:AcrR family transcriptional regulator
MSPRAYSMQRRSQQVQVTRRRIVDAALAVFAQRGARATTVTEVARVADVSPATVTNHFPTQDRLLEAVVARVMSDIDVPTPMIFTSARSVTARLRVLTEQMFAFFERTGHWFDLLGAELSEVPALARAEAQFWQSMRELYAEAVAGTDDEVLARATAGFVHPATYGALKAAGMPPHEASSVVADLLAYQARKGRR